MEIKTKRILMRTCINVLKLVGIALTLFIYSISCIMLSIEYTGGLLAGILSFFLPLVIYFVWDVSKAQIESEINKEERLVETIKRGY